VLQKNAAWPVLSPAGSKLAMLVLTEHAVTTTASAGAEFLRSEDNGDLFVFDLDKPKGVRLTHTPHTVELAPSWDPSGQQIAYSEFAYLAKDEAAAEGFGNEIREINADGTCPKVVFKANSAQILFSPAWQPGIGREAGPISC
jgi:hypothetical protein